MLKESDLRFVRTSKPGDHHHLFEQLEENEQTLSHAIETEDGCYHQFRFLNHVSLSKSNEKHKVHVLEYRCTDKQGKERPFAWVTDRTLKK